MDKLEDLLPAGDEARAEHVVDAEGLGRRGGRRGGVVHRVGELLLQLQVVQNQPVAVVGDAQAVRGLAVGGSSEVFCDKTKGRHASEIHGKQVVAGFAPITSLSSGKNSFKPKLLVVQRGNLGGNPVASAGLTGAILCPAQDCP